MSTKMCALNGTQIRILGILGKVPDGLTRKELEEKGRMSAGASLGTWSADEEEYYAVTGREKPGGDDWEDDEMGGGGEKGRGGNGGRSSLVALGMVDAEPEDRQGRIVTVYRITAVGIKAAKDLKADRPVEEGSRIKNKVLDRAAIAVRSKRAYGIERFTTRDLEEVKELLGEEYEHVSLYDIQRQMENRRKQGAFTSQEQKAEAAFFGEVKRAFKNHWAGKSPWQVVLNTVAGGKGGCPKLEEE